MFFLKCLFGGIAAVTLTWVLIVFLATWRAFRALPAVEPQPLRAVAGGWQYLMQLPWVLALLTVSFGVGLWLTSHYLARASAALQK